MRNTIILAALILARCGAVAVGAPAPLPLVVNSQSPTAPGLSCYRASYSPVRVSFVDGTNATTITTGEVPFLSWSPTSTNSGGITSTWTAVSGMTGVVDFAWSASDLNYAPGRYFYEAGVKSNTQSRTVRHGVLTIVGSPYNTGGAAASFTTNINGALYTFTAPWSELAIPATWLTNVTAGSGITQSAADARYTQRQGDYTGTVAGITASIVATSATGALARVAAVESAGYLTAALAGTTYEPTGAVARATAAAGVLFAPSNTYLTAEAQDLGDVLALGNDARGGAITNVGTIRGGDAGTSSGAELSLEKTADGGDAELRSADNGTSGVFLRAADGTVYRFYDQRADFGGATVSNVVIRGSVGVDDGAGTVASSGNTRALRVTDSAVSVVANSVTNALGQLAYLDADTNAVASSRLPASLLYSNSVASTLSSTAAPVSGAAVLGSSTLSNLFATAGGNVGGASVTNLPSDGGLYWSSDSDGPSIVAGGAGGLQFRSLYDYEFYAGPSGDYSFHFNTNSSGILAVYDNTGSGSGWDGDGYKKGWRVRDPSTETNDAAAYTVNGTNIFDLVTGGSGQTVSVGYTGDTLPYALTNGSDVAIMISTNPATGGGQTVSAGGDLVAATNGSAVAISYTRPTTMASTPWTDSLECVATGLLVYARGVVTPIAFDTERDPGNLHAAGAWSYSSTGIVFISASAFVTKSEASQANQVRILCNSDVIKLGTRDILATAGTAYSEIAWSGNNDAASNIWKVGFFNALGPVTNSGGSTFATRYTSLNTYRMKNAGE